MSMKSKYELAGLDINLIQEKFPLLNDYDEIVCSFLSDPFFKELEEYLDNEDYALAKDATKGLYILAEELRLMNLYMALLEIYEDLESEMYDDVMGHYKEMFELYKKIEGAFHV